MSSRNRELLILIIQFLKDENFKETAHTLEKESKVFFDMEYFYKTIAHGEWEAADKYMSGFTKTGDNSDSAKIFFRIRMQKYFETLDKDDLIEFARWGIEGTCSSSQEYELDTVSKRNILFDRLKELIDRNPVFQDKLKVPSVGNRNLKTLVTQGLKMERWRANNAPLSQNLERVARERSANRAIEIDDPKFFHSVKLHFSVLRLIYRRQGRALLAMFSNANYKLWNWKPSSLKARKRIEQPKWENEELAQINWHCKLINSVKGSTPCCAITNDDNRIACSYGPLIFHFNLTNFETTLSYPTSHPVTCLSFHPNDPNIFAVGQDDSRIFIFNCNNADGTMELNGHRSRVTGVAFSRAFSFMVSASTDARLRVWSTDRWVLGAADFMKIHPMREDPKAVTSVEFHKNQVNMLATHDSLMAVYIVPELQCLRQWHCPLNHESITQAAYSCDSVLVYAAFRHGGIGIFTSSTLSLQRVVCNEAYMGLGRPRPYPYPSAVVAHPSDRNQIAVGHSDGAVYVVEPVIGNWGFVPPADQLNPLL